MTAEVELLVNTFERTYRSVLAPGYFRAIEEQNRFEFARRVALIGAVEDREAVAARAQARIADGEIDEVFWVDERLPQALGKTGLTRRDLGDVPFFTDWALVAVTLPGCDWLLHWDADVTLEEPIDWITPALELMDEDRRLLVANPNWEADTLDAEAVERRPPFVIGRGFSDQVFLVRRREFARAIYSERCVARLRYPVAHLGHIFESRIDAYMRHHDRLRATHTGARYLHPWDPHATAYPRGTLAQRARRLRNIAVIGALRRAPWKPRCARQL
jgi:hypothetical protein